MSQIDFQLPDNLTISNVHALQEQLEAIVSTKECDSVLLQGDNVQRADTAGVQLLVAFVAAAKDRQIELCWQQPSDKLCTAAKVLGVENALGIQLH